MKTIMIIDDEPLVRDMLSQMMEREGYNVISAENGRTAYEMLQLAPMPDLIITDLIMPEMDGIELIREIRKKDNSVGIIALSGGSRHIDATTNLDIADCVGANLVISKPVERSTILEKISSLLNPSDKP